MRRDENQLGEGSSEAQGSGRCTSQERKYTRVLHMQAQIQHVRGSQKTVHRSHMDWRCVYRRCWSSCSYLYDA